MAPVGIALRIVLLVAWLAVTGTYAMHRLGLGSAPSVDPAAILASRLDRTLVYDLRWRPSAAAPWERAGSVRIGARHEDIGIRTSTDVAITNPRVIPGAQFIRQFLGGGGGRVGQELRLRFDQILDSRMRLQAVDIDGSIFGVSFSATGPVDHSGLELAWKAAGKSGSNHFPDVRPEAVSSGDLAVGLPAGLKPGARFSNRFASLEPGQLRLATKVAVFSVGERALRPTAAGDAELLEVEMRVDDRRMATLWCDDAGTVHRQELADQGLRLDLLRIDDQFGKPVWPKPAEKPAEKPAP